MKTTIAIIAGAVLCAGSVHAAAGLGVPEKIRYYETVTTVSTATVEANSPVGSRNLSFQAFGRQFALALEPNELFEPGARNVWVGREESRSEAPDITFYKGTLSGAAGSWVRVSLRGGALDGMIYTPDEVYFVEPASRHLGGRRNGESIIYRLSDTDITWEPGSCALDDPIVEAGRVVHAPRAGYDAIRSALPATPAVIYKQCQIGIVADYEYYLEHGASSAADMQSIINQIDGIYRSELNVTFAISQTVVYTTAADPFSGTTVPGNLLDEFSAYRNNSSNPVYGLDLAHLFTDRNLDSTTIGIAWIGALCSGYYGAGLSQDYSSDNTSLVILTAHELGHNFGAYHDNQGGSPCASTPFGYIMNPYVSTSLALQFSTCSKSYMSSEIGGASCLSSVGGGNTAPVANAGSDQTVSPSDGVFLSGTGSYDPEGTAISYLWEQISGSSVYLYDAMTATPSFWAPAFDDVVGFRLTVSDGSLSSTDTVYVTVRSGGGGTTPVISDISSRRRRPGTAATIHGSGFSYDSRDIVVSFGGLTARIRGAAPDNIRVTIPSGLRRRTTVAVHVSVGGVVSDVYWFRLN